MAVQAATMWSVVLALLMAPRAHGATEVLSEKQINTRVFAAKTLEDLVKLHAEQGSPVKKGFGASTKSSGGFSAENLAAYWAQIPKVASQSELEEKRLLMAPACETTVAILAETALDPEARSGDTPHLAAGQMLEIVFTLASNGLFAQSPWNLVWPALSPAAAAALADFKPQFLPMMAWAFASFAVAHSFFATPGSEESESAMDSLKTFFNALSQVKSAVLAEIEPQGVANMVWAYATTGNLAPHFFEAASKNAMTRMPKFDAQSLASMAWAFGTYRHGMPYFEPDFFEALAVEATPRLEEFSSQQLTNLAWAYAIIGHKSDASPGLFFAIGTSAVKRLPTLTAQEFANLAWAFAMFDYVEHGNAIFSSTAFTERAGELASSFTDDELGQLDLFNQWRDAVVLRKGKSWPKLPSSVVSLMKAAVEARDALLKEQAAWSPEDCETKRHMRRRELKEFQLPTTALGPMATPVKRLTRGSSEVDEEAWYDEWSSRLRCWLEMQPYQGAALHRCTVALSLMLSSRLERFGGDKAPRATDPSLAHVQPEHDCDWIAALPLPKFPSFNFHFRTPALPRLVPWGVQKWQELGKQSSLPQPLHSQPQAGGGGVGTSVYVGIAAAGFSLGALLILGIGRLQGGSSARVQVRVQRESAPVAESL